MNKSLLACLAAALFSFYDLLVLALFNRLNPSLQTQFALTPESLGVLSSCFLWANALALIPVGILLDRGHVRKTACFLLAASVLSNSVFMFSHTLWLAMVARFIQGCASAGSLLTCMRMAINHYKEKSNAAIGGMIAIALSGGIFANFTDSWLTPTLVGTVIIGILILFLHDSPRPLTPPPLQFIKKPQNFLMGGYLGFINFPVFILGSLWGNDYIHHHYHFTLTQSASISSLIFAGIMIGSPCWGFIANNYISPIKILYLGCGGLLLLCLLLPHAPDNFLFISALFLGLGFFTCTQNMAYFVLSKINPPLMLSSATAIAAVVFNSMGAVSQMFFYRFPYLLLFPLLSLSLLFISQCYSR